MDYNGVPGRGLRPRPDEGGELRGDAHSRHTPRGVAGPRLSALGEEAPQGHQSGECAAQRNGRRQVSGFW